MNNSSILIVEDEGVIAEHLKLILESSNFKNVHIVHEKKAALETIQKEKPNLVLLDIRLNQHLEGIEIAKEINVNQATPFIYITAHSDNSILAEALATKPVGFITKPFKKTDIVAAVNIALANNKKNTSFKFKDGYDEIILSPDEILFVKSEKNYIDIICKEKRFCIRNSLDWFLSEIHDESFVRVHRSYVVNMRHANKLNTNEISISNFTVPVSRTNYPAVKVYFK